MIKVGIVGLGGMGRMHYNCYGNNPDAKVVAIADVDERKRAGDWSSISMNVDSSKSDLVDLSDIATYADYADLIRDENVDLVDICLPTKMHAPVTIAALEAGRDVFCEKPMGPDAASCEAMEAAVRASGKQLMIGHCLRYWPQYVKAHEIMSSGEHGKPLYARLFRTGDTPLWSWNNWLNTGSQSGGAVFDMHIHDVDTALWWFGRPDQIAADGVVINDMPAIVDSSWRYDHGPVVSLHASWDNNGGSFAYAFKIVMERASIAFDSQLGSTSLQLFKDGKTTEVPVSDELGYQAELDDYIACLRDNRKMERVTPEGSRMAVEVTREELRQIAEKSGATQVF